MSAGRRLILHCGLPKTGTTALQRWVWQRRDALTQVAISYPGKLDPHEPKQGYLVPALRQPGGSDILATGLDAAPGRTVLLSNEGLSNHLYDFHGAALSAFRELTQSYETSVVIVTREPAAWLRSYHRQCVLNPSNAASDLWGTSLTLDEIRTHPRVVALRDHEQLAADLVAAFGAQTILRLDYGDPAWFETFLDHLGAPHPADRRLPRANDGLPDWMIETLRQINALAPGPRAWRAWRQAAQQCLKTQNSILLVVAKALPQPVDPLLLEEIRLPVTWSAAEKAAFFSFADEVNSP